jgi:primase-polymerase (primpol)-like protein
MQQYIANPSQSTKGCERIEQNVPDEMKCANRWLCWRRTTRGGKPTKVPYQVNGREADSTDPQTWTTFDRALDAYARGRFDGVGVALGRDGSSIWAGVDIDDCIKASDAISRQARAIIADLDSYTERSQSLTGIHVLMKNQRALPAGRRRKGNIELYDSGRYFVVTGDHVDGTPRRVLERGDAINSVWEKLFAIELRRTEAARRRAAAAPAQKTGLSDAQIIAFVTANPRSAALWNGDTSPYDGDQSRADLAFAGCLSFYCGRDPAHIDRLFRLSKLMRRKWDSRRPGSTYGWQTIAKALHGRAGFFGGSRP